MLIIDKENNHAPKELLEYTMKDKRYISIFYPPSMFFYIISLLFYYIFCMSAGLLLG